MTPEDRREWLVSIVGFVGLALLFVGLATNSYTVILASAPFLVAAFVAYLLNFTRAVSKLRSERRSR